jgi:hypothetical protein
MDLLDRLDRQRHDALAATNEFDRLAVQAQA